MKKKVWRRVCVVFVLGVYVFVSSFVYPRQHAQAIVQAGAIPLGIEVGAGVYVTGAIALAALVGAFGYTQYQDDISAHARRVWEAANDTVKKSLRDALVAAYTAGQKTITIPQDVYDYIKSKLGSLTSQARSITTFTDSSYGTASRSADGTSAGFSLSSPFVLYMYDAKTGAVINYGFKSVNIICNSTCHSSINGGYQNYAPATVAPAGDIFAIVSWINSHQSDFRLTVEYSGSSDSLGDIDSILDKSKGGIFEFSPSANTPVMTLPDIANFPAKDLVTGDSVTWNPGTQAWERNGVSVSNENVKVGSPTLSLDVPTAGDTVISYTDVVTGAQTSVTDTTADDATTGDDTTTAEDSPTKNPDVEANRWKELVTTKFPFSLPWDLYSILSVLNAEPRKPVLKLDATGHIAGMTVLLRFTQNIDFLDSYVPYFRTFLLIGYVLFLIFSTRRLLGGGQ